MKNIFWLAAAALLYLLAAPSPVLAFDSFGFYCNPYAKPFDEGKHYIPTDSTATSSGQCWFNIPSQLGVGYQVGFVLYKGVPGNAQFMFGHDATSYYSGDKAISVLGPNFTTFTATGTPINPKQDDDFFAVVYRQGAWDTNTNQPTSGASSDSYKIISWKWGAKPTSEWDPVIIIPGILGSWQNPLNGEWVIDPIKNTYDNLIDTLVANGYVKDSTIFTFPYNWEQSNITTAQQLAQKISQVKTVCGCSKVDLIAHSMGGLVATQYIESSDYQNDVDQLFMLGTPLAGAPKAYSAWEAGKMDFSEGFVNYFLNAIFERESIDNGYSSVFNYIHQKPVQSIQELLPLFQSYLKLGSAVLQYPTGYPQNPFLQNLIGDPSVYFAKVINKVQTYVVVGETGSASTTVGYQIKTSTQLPLWQDGEIISNINGQGDGTVPLDSAVMLSGPEKEIKDADHMHLPSLSSAYLFTQLTGKQPSKIITNNFTLLNPYYLVALSKLAPLPINFSGYLQTMHDVYLDNLVGHVLLFITLFSPIDVKVTAPDGKTIGKDFGTTSANQIPNAIYSGPIGEHEYVVILDPIPGQYKVETIGTGNGAYTIASGRIDAATTTTSLVNGTTTLNQIIKNTLFVSSTSTTITLTPQAPIVPPTPPIATSTPTTTQLSPDTCVTDLAAAYKAKWITKKAVFDTLTFDCKILKQLISTRDSLQKIAPNKMKSAEKALLAFTQGGIKLAIADMELLAKDKGNIKDGVLLITKYITWFKNIASH